MKNCFFILGSMLLVACSAGNGANVAFDVPVRKGAPIVYIRPLTEVPRNQRVGILPFIVPANMTIEQGRGVAAIFKDVLLKKRAFRIVKQIDARYGNIDEALNLGRESGVDLVMVGEVNCALAGTEMGGARVDLSVRLVSVKTGNTVWYIEQSVDQPMDYPDLSVSARLLATFYPPHIRNSQGAPAIPNMVVGIALNMAEVMTGADYVSRL